MSGRTKWQMLRTSISTSMKVLGKASTSSPSPGNSSLSTFHPFSRLPNELQIQIWETAVLSLPSRLLEIHEGEGNPTKCLTPPPVLLHVCRQSRCMALRVYTLAFPTSDSGGFYIDYEKDIIYFGPNSDLAELLLQLIKEPDLPKIFDLFSRDLLHYQKLRRIAISCYAYSSSMESHGFLVALHMGLFPFLNDLVILGRQIGHKVVIPGRTPTIWVSEILDFEYQYGVDPRVGKFKQGFWATFRHHQWVISEWNKYRDYVEGGGKRVDLRVGSLVMGKGDRTVRRQTWGGYRLGHMTSWAV